LIVPDSQIELQSKIQALVKDATKEVYSNKWNWLKASPKDYSDIFDENSAKDIFIIRKIFESLLSTIVLFIEQEPFTNVPMNLNTNFWHVRQENYTKIKVGGSNIKEAIIEENGNTFQNSPIHLVFYEKINTADLPNDDLVPTLNETPPQFFSMSYIRLKKDPALNFDEFVFNLELLMVLKGVTAQFVTQEQYQQLLFILGQKASGSGGKLQDYKELLTLFNSFHTNSVENFQAMLNQFQFPFVYNPNKSLAENRRDFKDFFSYLTNIRCSIVEGSHRCEAACRILQGYQLGDPVPLDHHDVVVPDSSTLFKLIPTQVYYRRNTELKLNRDVLKYLRDISENVAEQKNLIVPQTWHMFFSKVIEDINNHLELSDNLYDTQEEFYREEVVYRDITKTVVRSNLIKKYLHEVLTKAIFNYGPCKDLLDVYRKKKPTTKDWEKFK
jgi:hypothetical protein